MLEIAVCFLTMIACIFFYLWRDACAEAARHREDAVRWQERLYDSWHSQERLWDHILAQGCVWQDDEEEDEADWWKQEG